jgi:hypothetical protein
MTNPALKRRLLEQAEKHERLVEPEDDGLGRATGREKAVGRRAGTAGIGN